MGVTENPGHLKVPLKGSFTGSLKGIKGSLKGLGFRVWSFRKLRVPYLGLFNKDPTI